MRGAAAPTALPSHIAERTAAGRGGAPPVLQRYLREVDDLAYRLPRGARHDLRARIWTHCAEVTGGDAADDRIREALARLGTAEELVAGELERAGVGRRAFRPADAAPIHLLGASVLLLGTGAVVGLVLLWRSRAWRLRDKVLASLVVLAGPLAVLPVLPPLPALLVGVAALGPAAAAVQLLVTRLRRERTARPRPII